MSSSKWVLLTDGYYFKLMYVPESGNTLQTYRQDDFEKSSDITYNLITRYKKDNSELSEIQDDSKYSNSPDYALKLISKFLEEKFRDNAFKSLIIAAPESVLDALEKNLPTEILGTIENKIAGDYLNMPQDKLHGFLADKLF